MTPLVKELGMSQGNLSRWKYGNSPTADIVSAFAECLDVPTDYLLEVGLYKYLSEYPELKDQITENIILFFGNDLSVFERAWGKKIAELNEIEFAKALSTLVNRVDINAENHKMTIHYHDESKLRENEKKASPEQIGASLNELLANVSEKDLTPETARIVTSFLSSVLNNDVDSSS